MLYFQDDTPYQVYVVPANGTLGRSVFIDYDSNDEPEGFLLGLSWELAEFKKDGWGKSGPPIRITRKKAEQLMGNRAKFRVVVKQIHDEFKA